MAHQLQSAEINSSTHISYSLGTSCQLWKCHHTEMHSRARIPFLKIEKTLLSGSSITLVYNTCDLQSSFDSTFWQTSSTHTSCSASHSQRTLKCLCASQKCPAWPCQTQFAGCEQQNGIFLRNHFDYTNIRQHMKHFKAKRDKRHFFNFI